MKNPFEIKLARGGKVFITDADKNKFSKIGLSDKYDIEAINTIGLSNVKFTLKDIEQEIEKAYKELAASVNDYVISENSEAIRNTIINERNTRFADGDTDENIARYDAAIDDENVQMQYVQKFAETQKQTLSEWVSYLNRSQYPFSFRYLMLKSVLNDNYDFKNKRLLKRTNKTIRNFTPLDAGTLAEIYAQKSDFLLQDYAVLQLENIEKIVNAKEVAKTSGNGTWIKFNGGSDSSSKEIKQNAIELMQLVQDTYWCTKTNAKGQLKDGDFYVYVTEKDGKKFPRIAIRMEGDEVAEVRGNASAAQDLEPEMNPIAEDFLVNNLDGDSGKEWLESIRYNTKAYQLYLTALNEGIYEGFVEDFIELKKDEKKYLLDYADRNGHIERIERYLKENKAELDAFYGNNAVVFELSEFNPKETKIILGNADFSYSEVESLGNLQTIGGRADFSNSQVKDLGNLQTIDGYAYFGGSKIKSLGNLQTIDGTAYFYNSQVEDLGNLQAIGGDADFSNSKIESLGSLQTISGDAFFGGSQVKDLGSLQTIGANADFSNSQVKDLGNLQTIGGYAYFGGRPDLEKEWKARQATKLARGGKVLTAATDAQKFSKIGVTDKYEIEAINDIGLSGVKFTLKDIEQEIEKAYKELAASVNDYVISENSEAIRNTIINERNTRFADGDTDENIARYDAAIDDENVQMQYVQKFAETQKQTLSEWVSYLNQSEYPFSFRYLMLKSVLNDNYDFKNKRLLKRTNKTIRNFTPLDAGTLSEIYAQKSDFLLQDYAILQLENIEKIVNAKEVAKTSGNGTWIKFNGGSGSSSEEVEKNAIELMQLVQDTYWCTKTNAKGQLKDGDFYVYVTQKDGKKFPRIAIRMEGHKVAEVRGNASAAQNLEDEMIPVAEDFLMNNFDNDSGKIWLESVRYNKQALGFYKTLLEGGVYQGAVEEFIDLKKDEKKHTLDYANRNGHLDRIEKYLKENQGEIGYIYGKDVVVFDLKRFNLQITKIIVGDANFKNSQIKSLGNLETIGRDAYFKGSQIENLGNLKIIVGDAYFQDSKVKNLGKLQTIGGKADFGYSQVKSLGSLEAIGGGADFRYSQVKSLGKLETIGGGADFRYSQVKSLGKLETIGGSAVFGVSQIEDLGNLKTIGDSAYFNENIKSLGNLQTIGGDAYFYKRPDLEKEWLARQNKLARGGKVNLSKTPAPKKERIYGSNVNKKKSSSSIKSAKSIVLSENTLQKLSNKANEHPEYNQEKLINALKAIYRRGMGAYSVSHRPTISKGRPNSRYAWGLARVNAFLHKLQSGKAKNPNYIQDDDLILELKSLKNGGKIYRREMPDKKILEYGEFLRKKHPEVWNAGGNIFGNEAFQNLKRVSKRGYWLESEDWMYKKWQSFKKRHQHNHLLAGVVANIKWASWGNIGEKKAKEVIKESL